MYKPNTFTAVTADINRDLDETDAATFLNDDVTCVAKPTIVKTVDVPTEGN